MDSPFSSRPNLFSLLIYISISTRKATQLASAVHSSQRRARVYINIPITKDIRCSWLAHAFKSTAVEWLWKHAKGLNRPKRPQGNDRSSILSRKFQSSFSYLITWEDEFTHDNCESLRLEPWQSLPFLDIDKAHKKGKKGTELPNDLSLQFVCLQVDGDWSERIAEETKQKEKTLWGGKGQMVGRNLDKMYYTQGKMFVSGCSWFLQLLKLAIVFSCTSLTWMGDINNHKVSNVHIWCHQHPGVSCLLTESLVFAHVPSFGFCGVTCPTYQVLVSAERATGHACWSVRLY